MVAFHPPVAPLFVPASRPDRFGKADTSGTDAVILDLEDAVVVADKERARDAVFAGSCKLSSPTIVRINAAGTPWHEADLDAVRRLEGICIMLPKAENRQDIVNLKSRLGRDVPVIALVETALGLSRLPDILTADNVVMAAFGSVDFSLDLGCAHDRLPLLAARSELVWRSRAAGHAAPLDGVTTDLSDSTATQEDARHAAELGFGGKMAVHPNQVKPILRSFLPDAAQIEWARKVLSVASTGEALKVDGEMVDRPVLERARKILGRANLPSASHAVGN